MQDPSHDQLLDRQAAACCLACGHADGDALWLRFSGGYGQFVDPMMGDPTGDWVALCGRCLTEAPAWVRTEWPWVPAGSSFLPFGACIDCQRNLPVVVSDTGGGRIVGPDDVLTVTRTWGVLGATPKPHLLEPTQTARLCHDCAHEACETVSCFGVLLKPATSHAHTQEFWAANPHHDGWDRPERT